METVIKTRNVYTTAMRHDAIKTQIEAMNTPLNKEAILALIAKELSTKGAGQSTKVEPKTVNGKTYYHCGRADKWFNLENMVTTKDNESKGYSKESQDTLTAWNRSRKELEEAVITASTTKDFASIPALAEKLGKFEATESTRYSKIKGDLVA